MDKLETYAGHLQDGTPAKVVMWPIRIHHGGTPSYARDAWLLIEPAVEQLTMKDGALSRESGELVTLVE